MIEFKNFSFSYNKRKVIKDLNFSIIDNKINVILGKNGTGKSTLMKCVTKIYKKYQGEIYLDGVDIKKIKSKDYIKLISYLPQQIIPSSITVFDTILLGRLPYSPIVYSQNDYQIVNKLLSDSNMNCFKNKSLDELSLGERQKVMILKALATDNKYLLLDEPTSSLDIENQFEIMNLLKNLTTKFNKTIFISIHDLNQATKYGDNFLFISKDYRYKVCQKEEIDTDILQDMFSVRFKKIKDEKNDIFIYGGEK